MSLDIYKNFTNHDIKKLAKQKGFSYTQERSEPHEASSLYDNSLTQTKRIDEVQFHVDGMDASFYLAEYQPIVSSGGGAQAVSTTSFYVQVFELSLPYFVEDVYVESQVSATFNNMLGMASVAFTDVDTPILEGGFSDYFRVYVPRGESIEAFTILAPNIMSLLLDQGTDYDFEFSKNKLYIYKKFSAVVMGKLNLNFQEYKSFLDLSEKIAHKLVRAARPTKAMSSEATGVPLWKLQGNSHVKHVVMFILVFIALCIFSVAIFTPSMWGLILFVYFIFLAKKRLYIRKRKRLAAWWTSKTP